MEHPICYEVDFGPRKPSCLRDAVEYAIWDDNKEDFLRLIQDPEFQDLPHNFTATYILRHDSANIADALIKGQCNGLIRHDAWWFPRNNELYPDILDFFADDCPGPKLIKYFLERGCSVVESTNPDQWSTFHLAVNKLYNESECQPSDWNPEMPLFFLIQWLSRPSGRQDLEAVRLLVQNTQNKELVRKVIIDYAEDGQIVHLAALFLAVPELFLSSDFVSLGGRLLRPLDEEDTRILESLALLFDVIAMVGDKLVAYTRLDVSNNGCPKQLDLELDFLLREVARHKQGVSADDYIRRRISTSFDRKDEDRLNKAIEKKLSSMATLHKGCFEVFTNMSKKCEVILPKSPPPWFPPPWGKIVQPSVHSYSTGEASANITFDTKIIPANNNRMNKMTELTKFRSLASRVNASYIHMFAKRIVK